MPRAVVCPKISGSAAEGVAAVQVQDFPSASQLQGDQIRISVRSASINFPELLMMQNKYQFKPPVPFILCGEGAGVVTEVGSEAKQFKIGDRVFFSTGTHGAATEEIVLVEGMLQHLPDTLSFSQGAGFLMGYLTGYHALVQRGRLQKDEWLLVTGAGGGMGMAAVQLGKALGAKVIAAASSDAKLEVCKRVGADAVVNCADPKKMKDAVGKITGGAMCDVIYDPVGGDVFDNCVRCVASKGGARLLVVGFAEGRIPSLPANMALIKGFDLVGVRMGQQYMVQPQLRTEAMEVVLRLAGEGKLQPYIGAEYPMEKAQEAFSLMEQRKVIGKCCITFGDTQSKL